MKDKIEENLLKEIEDLVDFFSMDIFNEYEMDMGVELRYNLKERIYGFVKKQEKTMNEKWIKWIKSLNCYTLGHILDDELSKSMEEKENDR